MNLHFLSTQVSVRLLLFNYQLSFFFFSPSSSSPGYYRFSCWLGLLIREGVAGNRRSLPLRRPEKLRQQSEIIVFCSKYVWGGVPPSRNFSEGFDTCQGTFSERGLFPNQIFFCHPVLSFLIIQLSFHGNVSGEWERGLFFLLALGFEWV